MWAAMWPAIWPAKTPVQSKQISKMVGPCVLSPDLVTLFIGLQVVRPCSCNHQFSPGDVLTSFLRLQLLVFQVAVVPEVPGLQYGAGVLSHIPHEVDDAVDEEADEDRLVHCSEGWDERLRSEPNHMCVGDVHKPVHTRLLRL